MPHPKVQPKKLVAAESNDREKFYGAWLARVTGYEIDETTVRLCLRLQSPFRRTKAYASYQETAKSARANAEREAAAAKLAELDAEREKLQAILNGEDAVQPSAEPKLTEDTKPTLASVPEPAEREDEPGDAEPIDDDADFELDGDSDSDEEDKSDAKDAESVTLEESEATTDGDDGGWGDDDDPDDY